MNELTLTQHRWITAILTILSIIPMVGIFLHPMPMNTPAEKACNFIAGYCMVRIAQYSYEKIMKHFFGYKHVDQS